MVCHLRQVLGKKQVHVKVLKVDVGVSSVVRSRSIDRSQRGLGGCHAPRIVS